MAKAEFYDDVLNMGFVGGLFPDAKDSSDKFLRIDAEALADLRAVLEAVVARKLTEKVIVTASELLVAFDNPKDKLPKHAGEVKRGGEF
jgi:hypothetical protein